MLLQLLSIAGSILGFVFLTLSIASGLYYISEVVEEHTQATKRFLKKTIYAIVALHVLLVPLDGFPIKKTLFSVASYAIYFQNLKTFPFVSLTDPIFLLSVLCVLINHYLWFQHFNAAPVVPPQFRYDPHYVPPRRATFAEVASFFGICVWFVPFALFVSLSAGDYVLPTARDDVGGLASKDHPSEREPRLRRRAVGLVRMLINGLRDTVLDFTQGGRRGRMGSLDTGLGTA
ncbi:SVP26 (YHR181W) [Zygosaccharomyces parabailii]|nr:SVP26 (YHR181W) [Zygosaccharomyces parabailii]CDH10761.1 related to Protein SVP26 [Zygosaccharomyces bailii ISA1307]